MSDAIKIGYRPAAGDVVSRVFETLEEARVYAHALLGASPRLGNFYAVAQDASGRMFMTGTTWKRLFPAGVPGSAFKARRPSRRTRRAAPPAFGPVGNLADWGQ